MIAREGGSGVRSRWLNSLLTFAIAVLIGGFVVIGAAEFFHILQSGWLPGRKGPGLSASDHPLAFGAMMVFIGASLLGGVGLALICAAIAVRGLFKS